MTKSKTINVFLIDGEPSCRIKCTMQNWTGVIYKIPRTMIEKCSEGKNDIVLHLKQSGIYFLLGENVSDGNKAIYVGQASARKNGNGLLCRLLEHKNNTKEKYFTDWNEVIIFTTQNDSFGPTEISYLENKFTNLAKEANRYEVKNSNEPNPGNLTEEKESELLEFIDYARMIIPILGHKVFEPLLKKDSSTDNQNNNQESPIFTYKGKFSAHGILTNEGFILLKNSQISNILKESCATRTIKARKQYNSKINNFKTTEDILFTSPSAAAAFVGGCSLSGNVVWKTDDGKSPNEINL